MKVLNRIKSENVCSIDIETVRVVEKYEDANDSTKSAWEYKNKKEGVVPTVDELSVMWEQSASLYAEFSQICAVSITFLNKEKLYCREIFGQNEKVILEELSKVLENIEGKNGYRILGHASKFFDYPFICKRYVINDMDIPNMLDSTDLKPWEQVNLDTNDLWKMGGTGFGSSLPALCNVLGIPTSKVDISGDEVGKAYYNQEFQKIGRYCSYDSIATFNILRKLKKEQIFQYDDVTYVGETKKDKKAEQTPLQKLVSQNYFSDSIKEELKLQFKGKKLLKKDKAFIQTMLENTYIVDEFMKEDKVDVQNAKKAEIEEFLKTLK